MRTSRIKRNIDNAMKTAGLTTALVLVALLILCSGCQMLAGAGRDLSEAAQWSYRGIQSQLAQPSGRDRRPSGQWTVGDIE